MRRNRIFLSGIVLIGIIMVLGIPIRGVKDISVIENRQLATFPAFSFSSFFDTTYQQNMESALTDQLVFSESMKNIYTQLKRENLGVMVTSIKTYTKWKTERKSLADGGESFDENENLSSKQDESLLSEDNDSLPPKTNLEPSSDQEDVYLDQGSEELLTSGEDIGSGPLSEERNTSKEGANSENYVKDAPIDTTFTLDLTPLGSSLIEIDGTDYLIYQNRTVEVGKELLDHKVENYNTLVQNYPELDFYAFYVEADTDIGFVDGRIEHELVDYFYSQLDSAIETGGFYINSVEEYYNTYYKTDHHWDVGGQKQGYQSLIRMIFGQEEPFVELTVETIDDLQFNGSKARKLNDMTKYDEFHVLTAELGEFDTYIYEELSSYGAKEKYIEGNYVQGAGINHYAEANGGDFPLIEFDFKQEDKDNVVLFVDSYSNPINAFVASHFNHTYIVDLRHYQTYYGRAFDFGDFIQDKAIDKVVFSGCYYFHGNDVFLIQD